MITFPRKAIVEKPEVTLRTGVGLFTFNYDVIRQRSLLIQIKVNFRLN